LRQINDRARASRGIVDSSVEKQALRAAVEITPGVKGRQR
jgi:hypothetical protein